jgi:hypothetical protein
LQQNCHAAASRCKSVAQKQPKPAKMGISANRFAGHEATEGPGMENPVQICKAAISHLPQQAKIINLNHIRGLLIKFNECIH